jgi:N-acetylglucosaminyldiphosphoundecaprenol N-acetyl-beta-D-mannosaminyltransferase
MALDPVTMEEALARLRSWVEERAGCRFVVTPNVDHAVMLQRRADLREAYEAADLVVADGWPVVAAAWLLAGALPERVAGSDLVPRLFEATAGERLRVFLLGAAPGVAERAAKKIHQRWPHVEVVGTCSPELGFEQDAAENEQIVARVNGSQADVLVVGLGAPKQELWVARHRAVLTAPVALCVGATIDFLAEHRRRAPRWMQRCGLEWFYRLVGEPRRLGGRYARGAVVFPQLVVREAWGRLLRAALRR